MSEQLYSIKESTLTDIADALRRKHGETELALVEKEVPTTVINKTDNATGFDEMTGSSDDYPTGYYISTVEGASSIKVKIAYALWYTSTAQGWCDEIRIAGGAYDESTFPASGVEIYSGWDNGEAVPLTVKELTFNNTDSVTIYWSSGWNTEYTGYYAEVTGLNANGEVLGAIREVEEEVPRTYKSSEMAQAIDDIEVTKLPDGAFLITGNCQYRFAQNGWNWFIEEFGDKITTQDIINANHMFTGSNTLLEIPFDINMAISGSTSNQSILSDMLMNVSKIEKAPKIYLNATSTDTTKHKVIIDTMTGNNFAFTYTDEFIFKDDYIQVVGLDYQILKTDKKLEEEPAWLFNMVDWEAARKVSNFGSAFPVVISDCYKLKTYPSLVNFYSDLGGYYSPWYYMNFNNCYNLQTITLPRPGAGTRTSGSAPTFNSTYLLKHIKFDVQEDGTPYTANWKNTTLNLTTVAAPYTSATSSNFDITKKVTDDASYQLLKDDPEYFDGTSARSYCAYNHDAAVETINTLPDTSAYGTNTIKFIGAAGALTDGGAINTLTEEEIAVATAKGWTVTLT